MRRSRLLVPFLLLAPACAVDFPESWLHDGPGPDVADVGAGAERPAADTGQQDGPPGDGSPKDQTSPPWDQPGLPDTGVDQTVPTDGGPLCPAVCQNNCLDGVCEIACSSGCTCPAGMACEVSCGPLGCNGKITCSTGPCVVNCGTGGCSGDIDCTSSCACSVACGNKNCGGSVLCPPACTACLEDDGCDNCP